MKNLLPQAQISSQEIYLQLFRNDIDRWQEAKQVWPVRAGNKVLHKQKSISKSGTFLDGGDCILSQRSFISL